MAISEGLNGMNGKVWARAARERIGMTQHDVAVTPTPTCPTKRNGREKEG